MRDRSPKSPFALELLEARNLPALLVVNSVLDIEDANDSWLTLREAITLANQDTESDTITFAIDGPAAIVLEGALPVITSSLIINGWTQNGSANPSAPTVELSGENLAGPANGLTLQAGNSQILGLVIRDFNGYGLVIQASTPGGADQNTIQGNYIGTDVTGQLRRPNQLGGILIQDSADNLIGGNIPLLGNLISGNGGVGITLRGAGSIDITPADLADIHQPLESAGNQNSTTRNQIVGNIVGLSIDGQSPLGNASHGILLDRSGGNWIGGSGSGEGNIISGNGRTTDFLGGAIDLDPLSDADGIRILGAPLAAENPVNAFEAAWNVIRGNRIGTDPDGMSSQAGLGAAWLGNTGSGIRLGNYTELIAMRQIDSQVALRGGPQHTLIGVMEGEAPGNHSGNLISGNDGYGVQVDGLGLTQAQADLAGFNNWIAGNLIGTNATGDAPLGNQAGGVLLAAGASFNIVGGGSDATSNIISGNIGNGVHVHGTSELVSRSVTGDAGDGPYDLIAPPLQMAADSTDYVLATQTISTSGTAGTAVYSSTVKLLRDPFASEPLTALRTTTNSIQGNYIGTSGDGDLPLANSASGILVDAGALFTLIGNYYSRVNGPTPDAFAGKRNVISGNGQNGIEIRGVASFTYDSVLIDSLGNIVDPDTALTSVLGNYVGISADGATAVANNGNGVLITQGARGTRVGTSHVHDADLLDAPLPSNTTYADIYRNVISGNGQHGVAISGVETDAGPLPDPFLWYVGITVSNTVAGNYIGTDATGQQAIGNLGSGVVVGGGARTTRVGGFSTLGELSAGNLIAGNFGHGVWIHETYCPPQLYSLPGSMWLDYQVANHNEVRGNLIGVNREGNVLANGGDGILIENASGSEIGSLVYEGGNVISGNLGNGIRVSGAGSSGNLIAGNYIGTHPDNVPELTNTPEPSAAPIGNQQNGIIFTDGAHDNRLTALISTAKANYNLTNLLLSGLISLQSYQTLRARFQQEAVEIPGIIDPFNYEIILNGNGNYELVETPITMKVLAVRNVVEGNLGAGITVQGPGTTNNRIQAAYVGTNVNGELNVNTNGHPVNVNSGLGIQIAADATGNIFGAESTDLLFRSNRTQIHPSGKLTQLLTSPENVVYLTVDAAARKLVEHNVAVGAGITMEDPWVLPAGPFGEYFAGGPYSISEGQSLTLDATGTPDVFGPNNFAWDLTGALDFDDASGETPLITWQQLESLGWNDSHQVQSIWLRVVDSIGNIGYSRATLTINNVAPTASVAGPQVGVRGEPRQFTLSAADPSPVDQAANFTFEIDWNGDGTVDQVVVGPSGTTVEHIFSTSGNYAVKITATDKDGGKSSIVTHAVSIVSWALRPDDHQPSLTSLYWGGTDGIDSYGFLPGGVVFVQAENNQFYFDPLVVVIGPYTGSAYVFGQESDDLLLADLLDRPAILDGGAGEDILVGGRNSDLIFGGSGDDVLLGGTLGTDGDDTLNGGDGDDLIIGHLGSDLLVGAAGDDLLIAGSLAFENTPSAVYSIQAEWLSGRPYLERVANLTGTGNGTGNNGDVQLIPGVTVSDDGAIDEVFGGDDEDWLLLGIMTDLAPDLEPNESILDV